MFGVAESFASDSDPVDPGLKLRGQAMIVHGRADHDEVGRKELVYVLSAQRDVLAQSFADWAALEVREMGWGQVHGRRFGQVMIDDFGIRMMRHFRGDDV